MSGADGIGMRHRGFGLLLGALFGATRHACCAKRWDELDACYVQWCACDLCAFRVFCHLFIIPAPRYVLSFLAALSQMGTNAPRCVFCHQKYRATVSSCSFPF